MNRVVILSGVYPDMRCGCSLHAYRVAQEMSRTQSWDIQLLTSNHPDIDRSLKHDFELHPRIDSWRPWRLPNIIDEIERLRPDVLHVQAPTAAYAGRLHLTMPLLPWAGRRLWHSTRLVVTQHDLAIGHRSMQCKHHLLLRSADAITVSNDRDFQAIARLSPKTLSRTHRAPLGSLFDSPALDPKERHSIRQSLGIEPEDLLIAYFGFLIPSRKIETIIESARILSDQQKNIHFLFMGGTGPGSHSYVEHCKRLAEKHDLTRQIHWTGYLPNHEIETNLAVSDLFVSAIERGADFRNSTLIAAMNAGLPILTTQNRRYGIDRELEQSGACLFFDPDSPSSLAQSIQKMAQNPSLRLEMSNRAQERAQQHTWPRHASVLDRAYRGLPPEPGNELSIP